MAQTRRPPWKQRNPRKAAGRSSIHLTTRDKATARGRAKRAGRRYPNLVDNMRVTAKKKRRTGKRSTWRRKSRA